MDSVSQNGRRKPRPWTAQEQVTVEVAAACGVPLKHIAKVIDRPSASVRHHLLPSDRTKNAERSKAWATANPAKVRAAIYAWRERNPSRYLANIYRWRARNPDKTRATCLRYKKANRKKIFEIDRRWRAANPDKVKDIRRRWIKTEKAREACRRRNSARRAGRLVALRPLTLKDKKLRFQLFADRCTYCEAFGVKLTADHVLALSAGGLDEAANIVPACFSCNSSKRDRPVESWYRSQQFFSEARWAKIRQHCPAATAGQLPLALPA
jgi:hypothetical protein